MAEGRDRTVATTLEDVDMVEVAWATVGLLAAALFGSFFYFGSKIDSLGASLNGRMDALNARIDGLGARLDAHIDDTRASAESGC